MLVPRRTCPIIARLQHPVNLVDPAASCGYNPRDMESQTQALRQIDLFATLSEDAMQRIARVAMRRSYCAGEIILLEGEPCRAAYFVYAGQARAFRNSPSGREQVLMQFGPGDAFNLVPLFREQGRNHASVQAITGVTLVVISRDDLQQLVRETPELALVLLHDLAQRLDHLTDLVESLSLRTVRGRLARFLLDHAEESAVSRHWTQDEMAARLGTVRDMVGRTLRTFADAGLIRMERNHIVLLDREGLESEAES
jgi:CRP/FNR family cyclic AMP-dependent transcriptional regulator